MLSTKQVELLLRSCKLCSMAYLNPAEFAGKTANFSDVQKIYPVFRGSDSCYVIELKDALIIAIRGTTDIPDWLRNIRVLRVFVPWTKGRIHKGFWLATQSLVQGMQEEGVPLDSKPIKLITGHSLGGAIAILMSHYLKREYQIKTHRVVTFGAPRIGTRAWAIDHQESGLSSDTWQVRNAPVDVVTRVFFSSTSIPVLGAIAKLIGLGYYHPYCQPVILNADGRVQEGSAQWESLRDRNPISSKFKKIADLANLSQGIANHMIGVYQERLEKLAARQNSNISIVRPH